MSFETGWRIDDKEALAAAGIPLRQVLDALIDFYIEQMLVRGYFHADPHPGNILVRADGSLTLLDFGMTACSRTQSRASWPFLASRSARVVPQLPPPNTAIFIILLQKRREPLAGGRVRKSRNIPHPRAGRARTGHGCH